MKSIKHFIIGCFVLTTTQSVSAQKPYVEVLTTGTKTSLRGLSVVNDNVVWVSGSGGMVGKSSNAGKNWKWMTVKGFEKVEFRDIEAFDASTAIIMAVGEPAYILKTTDGGETWKTVYEDHTKGMFLDAMDFSDARNGIVVGDPIDGKIFLAETVNGGESWTTIGMRGDYLRADSGEAFFAASGTNIRLFKKGEFIMVSGGLRSRLFNGSERIDLPMIQGKETTGANSIDIYDNGNGKGSKRMIVVGGDFNADSSAEKSCFMSDDGGKTWKAPKETIHGYRSCVEFLSKDDLLACGLNGVDYSFNGGRTWQLISHDGFNTCHIAKLGSAIFLTGNKGTIARIIWK